MDMREQFESRFPTPVGVEWDAANQCYKCKMPSPYLALWMGWTARDQLSSTTCPGHGRSECVSCCWPKCEVSGVELGRQLVEQVLSVMPENYAGHSFGVTAPDGSTLGDVIITVVKPDGKGPHELRVEAECRAKESDRLRDAMEVAINTLVYCYDKRPENFAAALTEAARLADESRSAKI